jgi:hypothetical protein
MLPCDATRSFDISTFKILLLFFFLFIYDSLCCFWEGPRLQLVVLNLITGHVFSLCLFHRPVRLALLELLDVLLNGLVDAALQLWAVAEREENLEPNEEWRQEDSLDEVV